MELLNYDGLSEYKSKYDEQLSGIVADVYDNTSTYSIGDYCIHYAHGDNKLYKCIVDIVEAEEWNATHWIDHWIEVTTTGELEDIQDVIDDIEGRSGDKVYGPADIVTFDSSIEGVPFKKVEATFSPIQYLHGYDHPWPPGGGKNLLHNTASSKTENGITFTVNVDGSVKVQGTATKITTLILQNPITVDANVSYTVSSGVTGDNINTYCLQVYTDQGGLVRNTVNGKATFTTAEGTNYYIRIYVNSDVQVNLTFYPMIILGNTDNLTWAPYENICPIEGWTECEVEHKNKNIGSISELFYDLPASSWGIVLSVADESISLTGTATISGLKFFGGLPIYSRRTLEVKAGITYTISCKCDSSKCGLQGRVSHEDNSEEPWLLFTVDADTGRQYCRFSPLQDGKVATVVYVNLTAEESFSSSIEDIQMCVGDQIAYIGPSSGKTVPISWKHAEGTYEFSPVQEGSGDPSPENVRPIHPGLTITRDDNTELTVYGGSITFNDDGTSSITEKYAKKVFDGSTDEARYPLNSREDLIEGVFYKFPVELRNSKTGNLYCDRLAVGSVDSYGHFLTDQIWRIAPYAAPSTYSYLFSVPLGIASDSTELNQYLTTNPITVVYPLATPTTYTLSITETQRAIEALGDKVTTTIYGGVVTLNEDGSADLVSDRGIYIVTGNETTWSVYRETKVRFHSSSGIIGSFAAKDESEMISNMFVGEATYSPSDGCFSTRRNSANVIITFHSEYFMGVTVDSAKAKAKELYEAGTPIIVSDRIINPSIYHFDNIGHLKSFLGQNNVWTNLNGTTAVTLGSYLETITDYVKTIPNVTKSSIAPTETSYTATSNYSINDIFFVNDKLYRATAQIASGGTITPGTNCVKTSVDSELTSLLN